MSWFAAAFYGLAVVNALAFLDPRGGKAVNAWVAGLCLFGALLL